MAKTHYSPYEEINELQTNIMRFVDKWVREVNTPVPRKEIMKAFTGKKSDGKNPAISVEGAINALLHKGYIRRGYTGTNKTTYVQLRNI